MKRKSVLFLGCGDIGLRTAALLDAAGMATVGLRRNTGGLPGFMRAQAGDYTRRGGLDCLEALAPDFVVATPLPADYSEAGYRLGYVGAVENLLQGLGNCRPRLVLLVSSTRVYAERDGGWVDEDSPLAEDEPRARALIDAERLLAGSGLAGSAVRCGGIYGNPAGRLLSRLASGEVCAPRPVLYSNRIHREDCAGFLAHLVRLAAAGDALESCYTAVDDCPAPRHEVERWLCAELGVEAHWPDTGPEAAHKRCRNARLHASGYTLRYPDYRSGYRAVLAARSRG